MSLDSLANSSVSTACVVAGAHCNVHMYLALCRPRLLLIVGSHLTPLLITVALLGCAAFVKRFALALFLHVCAVNSSDAVLITDAEGICTIRGDFEMPATAETDDTFLQDLLPYMLVADEVLAICLS